MQKTSPLHFILLALIALVLASCASAPQTTTSNSPMERNQGNGLASYMH